MTQEAWWAVALPIAILLLSGLGTWAMKEPANFIAYIAPFRTLIGIPVLLLAQWQFAISAAVALLATEDDRHAAELVTLIKLPTAFPVVAILLFVGVLTLDGFARFRLARAKSESKAQPNTHADC